MKVKKTKEKCDYCGQQKISENGKIYTYECPQCSREGCDFCMPAGNNCICPECEESIEDEDK